MGRIQCSKQKRNEIYEILTEINNSAKSQNQLTKIYNTMYVADKNKVVWETSVGRKWKLSLYPSKKKKRKTNVKRKGSYLKPNYMHITEASSDENVQVTTSSSEGDFESPMNTPEGYSVESSVDEVGDTTQENNDGKGDSSVQHEFSAVDEFVKYVKESDLLDNLGKVLYESDVLFNFLNLMELLSTKALPCDNIVFVLLLERVKFQMCKSTVGMRYSEQTKSFWSIVYRLCKGIGLKFFSGAKNWGQVVKRETTKSNYEPSKAKVNFAVPHENILRHFNRTLPKIIPPGKIEASLRMLAGKKDIILMGDGKLVTKGLTSNFCGDVNLFGHETSPNLVDLKDDLKSKLTFIAKCTTTYHDADVDDKYQIVDEMIKLLTSMIKEI